MTDVEAPCSNQILEVAFGGHRYPVSLRLPARLDRAALVLNLHGSHSNGSRQSQESRSDRLADQYGFVVACPDAAIAAEVPNPELWWLWNVPGVPTTAGDVPAPDARDDVDFLTAVIDAVDDRYGTGRRACLVGMSGGARMASAYALAHPDRVHGLAAVAGLRAGASQPVAGRVADDHEPVPVLAVHGDADATNPYDRAVDARWSYSAHQALVAWARRNRCAPAPETSVVADQVTKISYAGADTRETAVGYRIAGGGHSWPGGTDPEAFAGFDTTATVGAFFQCYAR